MRLACLLDAPDAFGSSHAAEHDQDEARWRERLAQSAWFVAERDGEPVGLVRGARTDEVAGRRYLHSMWVSPVHRGTGVAAVLIVAVRDWAVSDGGRELALWVLEGNVAAARLYAREGFAPTGLRQPLPARPSAVEEQWSSTLP